jgi:hypothetical protein
MMLKPMDKATQTTRGRRYSPEIQGLARYRGDHLHKLLERLTTMFGTPARASFSSYAGCGMCPCSPGFVLAIKDETPRLKNFWRHVIGTQTRPRLSLPEKYERLAIWLNPASGEMKIRFGGKEMTLDDVEKIVSA